MCYSIYNVQYFTQVQHDCILLIVSELLYTVNVKLINNLYIYHNLYTIIYTINVILTELSAKFLPIITSLVLYVHLLLVVQILGGYIYLLHLSQSSTFMTHFVYTYS